MGRDKGAAEKATDSLMYIAWINKEIGEKFVNRGNTLVDRVKLVEFGGLIEIIDKTGKVWYRGYNHIKNLINIDNYRLYLFWFNAKKCLPHNINQIKKSKLSHPHNLPTTCLSTLSLSLYFLISLFLHKHTNITS